MAKKKTKIELTRLPVSDIINMGRKMALITVDDGSNEKIKAVPVGEVFQCEFKLDRRLPKMIGALPMFQPPPGRNFNITCCILLQYSSLHPVTFHKWLGKMP